MQQPLSTVPQPEPENRCPDCLRLELEGIPVQPGSDDIEQLDLFLSMNFNEQWESLLDGRVKFGLKGGVLRLELENSELSLASSELKTDKFHLTSSPVSTKGSETNPVWVFELKTGELLLKDSLKNALLGTVNVKAKPWRIEATFEVSKQDVYLNDAEGLWRHDISPNKHAVLERKLALLLLETKLKPYLSRAQLCYEYRVSSATPVEQPSEASSFAGPFAIASQTLKHLQDLIQRISEAQTKDFLELAKTADLNPLTDFAGGNLRGTSISGIELNGANLCRANLKGADLSDADLSDANLSSAKLGGADLSGAFLSNADLTYTDLHRASLALANLSGANLSGANLREANLSSANLSGAGVKEAQFGKNSGISEELKQNLKQRGAIFEES